MDLLRALEPEFRRIGLAYEAEKAALAEAEPAVLRAMASVEGVIPYPDPTTTLRFGYGVVAGFDQRIEDIGRKVRVAPVATLATFYEWAEHNPIDFPFAPPARWLEAKSRVSSSSVMSFTSTADLSFGGSGSPAVDRDGRIIGLTMGGILENGDDYAKWDSAQRNIHVATPAILEAVKHVYGAARLADELTAGRRGE